MKAIEHFSDGLSFHTCWIVGLGVLNERARIRMRRETILTVAIQVKIQSLLRVYMKI